MRSSKKIPHHPHGKFQLSFKHFFKFFSPPEYPPPRTLQFLLWRKYEADIVWNLCGVSYPHDETL